MTRLGTIAAVLLFAARALGEATITDLAPASPPSSRSGAALVETDLVPESHLLFGGNFGTSGSNDLFGFDPQANSWAGIADVNPPGSRAYCGAAWDSKHRRLVVYGGLSKGLFGSFRDDLWAWDAGTLTWTQLAMADAPPPRWGMVFEYLPHLDRFLVSSGGTGFNSTNTTVTSVDQGMWLLSTDYAAATATFEALPAPATRPAGRGGACVGYDPVAHELHVFSGESSPREAPCERGSCNDQWRYQVDANLWVKEEATGTPPARLSAMCTWDRRNRRLLVYGGTDRPGGSQLGDAHAYDPAARAWTKLAPQVGAMASGSAAFSPLLGGMVWYGGRKDLNLVKTTYALVLNDPPVARAGADQEVAWGAQVVLDGLASSDPNGDALAFAWKQTTGDAVELLEPGLPVASFPAPQADAVLEFELTVRDRFGLAASDRVRVSVRDLPDDVDGGADGGEPTEAGDAGSRLEDAGAGGPRELIMGVGCGGCGAGAGASGGMGLLVVLWLVFDRSRRRPCRSGRREARAEVRTDGRAS